MKARDTTLGHSASLILIMRSFAGMVISPSCRSLPISAYEPPQLHEWKDSVWLDNPVYGNRHYPCTTGMLPEYLLNAKAGK